MGAQTLDDFVYPSGGDDDEDDDEDNAVREHVVGGCGISS